MKGILTRRMEMMGMTYHFNLSYINSNMRKIVDSYVTRKGELRAIYSTGGSKFKHKDIELKGIYEINYKLGGKESFLKGQIIGWTEEYRTIFFKVDGKEIGVPINNITAYVRKE